MNIKVFLLICSFTISTCLGNTIYYLHESTDIIRTLIENKQLSLILEDVNQENLALLINNYSPAIIALESEAFNSTLPVILFFYKESDTTYKKILNLFIECSDIYANRLKCIAIDVDKLPAIAQAL